MALTDYVARSLFYFLVIDGYGMGLIRTAGAASDFGLALGLAALQIVASRMGLDRFRFGPLEWLWRSATYGRRQTLRIA